MTPGHIAIILDGNRRFAKKLALDPKKGHEYGYEKIKELLDWCKDLDIKELTFYAFSMQNFNRPKDEFDYLMDLVRRAFNTFGNDPRVKEYGIKVNVIGRYHLFPKDVVDAVDKVVNDTKHNHKFKLNFAVAYGGKEELTDTMKKIAVKVANGELTPEDVDEKVIQENLYMASEPDLIIRTGGDKRTSNFLMWQAAYSEWFFIDKMWPEFEKDDLIAILKEFEQRERRFGK